MKEIVKYVKDRKGHRIGVMIGAINSNGDIFVGWSHVHRRLDKFNPQKALEIARGRMDGWNEDTQVPHVIKKQYPHFSARCLRYFKGNNLADQKTAIARVPYNATQKKYLKEVSERKEIAI